MSDELHLWRAVVQQALADATTHTYSHRRARAEARRWLTTPSEDFNDVCLLAGLEPSQVRDHAKKLILEAGDELVERNQFGGRPARKITDHNGETLTVAQWAKRLGLGEGAINARLRKGLPVEQLLAPRGSKAVAHA
ncbi:hypothetical protein [Methylobacterium oxalidis]|uniref:hypothetical protein n=1 Tax=Methylobacterium oxalidis TaxID=944322 RepID=UPI0033148619